MYQAHAESMMALIRDSESTGASGASGSGVNKALSTESARETDKSTVCECGGKEPSHAHSFEEECAEVRIALSRSIHARMTCANREETCISMTCKDTSNPYIPEALFGTKQFQLPALLSQMQKI